MARLTGILLLVLGPGCQAWRDAHPLQYQTIKANPHRDTNTAKASTERAAILIEKGHLVKAERRLQEALIADVRYGPAHCNLGQIYFLKGDYYLAAWEFEYAAKLMPNRPEPLNNLGLVFEKVSRLEEALGYYEMARELDPRHPEYLGNLVRVKLRLGDRDEQFRYLLRELLLYETRPVWREWAEEQFALVDADLQSSDDAISKAEASDKSDNKPAAATDAAAEILPARAALNGPGD